MNKSILNTIKDLIGGIPPECTDFDSQIIIHINSVFSILNNLGFGPDEGFSISDAEAEWSDYLSNDKRFDMIKTYIYLKVKIVFDPSISATAMKSNEELIRELEWRINQIVEDDRNKEVSDG